MALMTCPSVYSRGVQKHLTSHLIVSKLDPREIGAKEVEEKIMCSFSGKVMEKVRQTKDQ